MRPEANKLVIWHEFDGPGDTSIELLEQLCRDYSRTHRAEVVLEMMNISELASRLNRVAAGGEAPQMALVPADMAAFADKARYSVVPAELLALVSGQGMEFAPSMNSAGVPYGLPVLTGNHLVLYYNRDLFPEPPGSWEEIAELGQDLKSKGIRPVAADLQEPYWFMPFLTAFGGWPIQEGVPALPETETQQALAFVRKQFEKGLLCSMDGSTELLERFIAGETGAILGGEWSFNHLDRHMGSRLGVARLPSVGGRSSISMTSAIGLVFPGGSLESELRREILSFARFMLKEEVQEKWGTAVQRIPVHAGARERLKLSGPANRGRLAELAEECRSMPIEPAMSSVWEAMRAGLTLLLDYGAETAYAVMRRRLQFS
ncbi:extracellular solute-binding protein [Paenibacillus macerans]|uniref:Maltodextrin-binding protein n=1 Tax=Paenibacillus macerans TaxID=44252 RepID=A0A6N8F334_PAEMA|nr:extracellular solute-binding protein [Paenibacillus macerans]MEC0332799.1 extracellular solute-binding protein [Paenibacillus macerans]MED4956840.1 extracellular solute-binding protein [Paenibacillus macerans]MUG25273.1 extracellular solute-binding protein [Paenibacillus macerans]UMV49396.1 extracellular solute-binding protein [Paenibacillus macerans]